MKGKSTMLRRADVFIVALAFCFLPSLLGAQIQAAELKQVLSAHGFIGDREWAGKFDVSGNAIEAHQHCAPELDGAWTINLHSTITPLPSGAGMQLKKDS